MARFAEPQRFEAAVEGWLVEALAGGSKHFDELVTSLPGVYPGVVLDALRHVVSHGSAPGWLVEDARKDVEPNHADGSYAPRQSQLPIPHPLDYDWRFGNRAIDYLLAEALRYTSAGDGIVLIGAPSLFVAAIERSYPREIRLLDANPSVTDRLAREASDGQVVRCDVLYDALPRLSAKVVVIDPPWYEDHFRSFLWAAVELCQMGGRVVASVPPVGTRPGITQEWRRSKRSAPPS
jgi:hypothetical protein